VTVSSARSGDVTVVAVGSTRVRWRDLGREVVATLAANRLRSLASGLAVFVAAAALAAVLVVSATVANQVSDEFDALRATSVRVVPTKDVPPDLEVFPDDAELRLAGLPGVRAGGVVVTRPNDDVAVSTGNATEETTPAQVIGIDNSVLDATDAVIDGARVPVAFDRGATVAYVGDALATRIGVPAPTPGATPTVVMIDGLAFDVVGVLRDPKRLTELADSVVIPRRTATRLAAYDPSDASILIETAPGAADAVGRDVPLLLAPERADPYIVDVPPEARKFRRRVEEDVQALVFAMAALSAFVGAISIASAAYSGVVERTGEFGLRRAVGAKPRHLATQVVAETVAVAALAGATGAVMGLLVALTVSTVNDWVTIVDPVPLAVIPGAAVVLGVIAGLLPARTAGRIDPAVALRRG